MQTACKPLRLSSSLKRQGKIAVSTKTLLAIPLCGPMPYQPETLRPLHVLFSHIMSSERQALRAGASPAPTEKGGLFPFRRGRACPRPESHLIASPCFLDAYEIGLAPTRYAST